MLIYRDWITGGEESADAKKVCMGRLVSFWDHSYLSMSV